MVNNPEGYKRAMSPEDADLFARFLQKMSREGITMLSAHQVIGMAHGWIYCAMRGGIKTLRPGTRDAICKYLRRKDKPVASVEQAIGQLVAEFSAKIAAENLDAPEMARRTGIGIYAFGWKDAPPRRISARTAQKVRDYLGLPVNPYVPNSYAREAARAAKMGERNPRWNGGVAEYMNHAELKRQRLVVLRRANGKCEICGDHANRVHHIDGDKANHATDNLLAVCLPCHTALHTGDARPHLRDVGYGPGRNSSKYRKLCGMSIAEMADSISVSPSIVGKYLKGHRKFSPEILARLTKLPPAIAQPSEATP